MMTERRAPAPAAAGGRGSRPGQTVDEYLGTLRARRAAAARTGRRTCIATARSAPPDRTATARPAATTAPTTTTAVASTAPSAHATPRATVAAAIDVVARVTWLPCFSDRNVGFLV